MKKPHIIIAAAALLSLLLAVGPFRYRYITAAGPQGINVLYRVNNWTGTTWQSIMWGPWKPIERNTSLRMA